MACATCPPTQPFAPVTSTTVSLPGLRPSIAASGGVRGSADSPRGEKRARSSCRGGAAGGGVHLPLQHLPLQQACSGPLSSSTQCRRRAACWSRESEPCSERSRCSRWPEPSAASMSHMFPFRSECPLQETKRQGSVSRCEAVARADVSKAVRAVTSRVRLRQS